MTRVEFNGPNAYRTELVYTFLTAWLNAPKTVENLLFTMVKRAERLSDRKIGVPFNNSDHFDPRAEKMGKNKQGRFNRPKINW